MRFLIALVLVAALGGFLWLRAEPLAPTVALETPVDVVGRATPLRIVARDRGTGLARVEVRLVPPTGPASQLMHQAWPRRSWRGSGVHEVTLELLADAVAARVPEGPAALEVWAADHSWLARGSRSPLVTRSVTVDVTAPALAVVSEERVGRVGGSECVVYRVGPDAVGSGVQVNEVSIPGAAGLFADPALRAALFPLPQDLPDVKPVAVAFDAAGNRRTAAVGLALRPRRFTDKTLPITDDFLARKVPELLSANGLADAGDLVAGYLRINRELRVATEKRVREICRESVPRPLWQGAFLRLPDSAPLSGFADRRTYVHDGKEIDHQTHLGFDLASLRGAVVPAGNAGRVVFAGALGIYGNTVILDHGLGLFSLYGHLSEVGVTPGAEVARGAPLGKTGETGLAGGDHLHFSIMIHGVHVDPVEWWDAHWIQDHVTRRLEAFPRAAGSGA